jgi:acyl-CoA thioesterase
MARDDGVFRGKGVSPFRDLVGYQFTSLEKGYSRCVLEVEKKLLNAAGIMHGGAIFALADAGMGGALWSSVREGELYVTLECQIVYFRAVSSGTLVCETRLINRGKRIATLEAEVRRDGELVAKAVGTYLITRANKDQPEDAL